MGHVAVDVEQVLRQWETAAAQEPMHGKPGEVRTAPSTDQKKIRRGMQRKSDLEEPVSEPTPTVAALLRSAQAATTLAEQQSLVAQAERQTSALIKQAELDRSLGEVSARVHDALVPAGTHELVTASTDWLLELPPKSASRTDAEHALIAEATMWFRRTSDAVKAHPEEFTIQAENKARHIASQYDEHAESAAQAFLVEAARLHAQAVAGGLQTTAMLIHDLDDPNGGMVERPDLDPKPVKEPAAKQDTTKTDTKTKAKPTEDRRKAPMVEAQPRRAPLTRGPIDEKVREWSSGQDANGVRGMSEEYAQQQLARSAALSHEASAKVDRDTAQELFGDDLDDNDDNAHTAASTLEQVGTPTGEFPTYSGDYPNVDTSSNRAPALQQMQGYTGWDGASVVPPNDQHAEQENDDTSGIQNATADSPVSSAGFPVGSALQNPGQWADRGSDAMARLDRAGPGPTRDGESNGVSGVTGVRNTVSTNQQKESHMEHASCPTCAGRGHVAVRKVSYSGLPQIDQIVSADETPGATPYPEQVAFPLTGWDQGNVERTIGETEQQIAARPQGRPGAPGPGGPGGAVTAGQRQANGRDNSGWIGDMGAKGTDYPGYSTPVGYDGSSNLGQPDPVYGYGGDQPNKPIKPYGASEEQDYTNDQGQNWQPGQPTQDDQGWREVANDPMVTSAKLEIQRQQQLIESRAAAIRRRQAANAAPQR